MPWHEAMNVSDIEIRLSFLVNMTDVLGFSVSVLIVMKFMEAVRCHISERKASVPSLCLQTPDTSHSPPSRALTPPETP